MLRSFGAWLDEHLVGPSGVIRALVDLLVFAVLLGALLGSVAIEAGVFVAGVFGLMGRWGCCSLIVGRCGGS
ncbi:hypothetical protein [Actinocrispum sp. NPDC049592]|uniref:hypothetical protein n=1 Tax=Actinocrispum sp. NPDC049592 TaxID=3154835 RepID=UPI003449E0C4